MMKSPIGIFQFESPHTFKTLKDFNTNSIQEMAIATAMVRPAGASYRDRLTKKEINKNPSELIDNLLKDNYGFLVFQEDVSAFLQQICGFSGSESDTIRRGIGRKIKEIIDKAMPKIIQGYCDKSDKSQEVATEEVQTFLQIIEDASSYMFNKSHAIAYSMIGYICAYYRYYYPLEFLTAFFNCSKSEEDFVNGTNLAKILGIQIQEPKFGFGRGEYSYNKKDNIIYKGMSSIKNLSLQASEDLYKLRDNNYDTFVDLLLDIKEKTCVNKTKLDILIKLDFFDKFGNINELLKINEYFVKFKQGTTKKINKEKNEFKEIIIDIVKRHSLETNLEYTKINSILVLKEIEKLLRTYNIKDISFKEKIEYQLEYLGYINVCTNNDSIKERRKLVILDVFPLVAKSGRSAGKIWAYKIKTQSIGSGRLGNFTIMASNYQKIPFKTLDIIYLSSEYQKNDYWYIDQYAILES